MSTNIQTITTSSVGDCYTQSLESPLVLIVDDNPDDRDRYIRLLRKLPECDYRYIESEGYTSMRERLENCRVDCVILDYSLPGMNGLDILKAIIPKYPNLPVIMMTGQGNETIAVEAIKEGAQHYLVKSEITAESLQTHIFAAIKHCEMQKERHQLIQKLMDSNTALERFAYVASHDLQEPVRMVNHFGKILLSDYEELLDNDGKEYLSIVAESGVRMRDMINDLLEYSRLNNQTLNFHLFDSNQSLEGALENLKALIEEQRAVITSDILPMLYGSPIQIMRLLQNLIANAIRYKQPDSVPVIHIGLEDADGYWRIHVKDNGIGIDPKFHNQIFEPFRRLHTWDSIRGSGLGLAICRKIAEGNNGTLTVSSMPGKGSTFTFTVAKAVIHAEAV